MEQEIKEDPLFNFFTNLIDNEQEKEILRMMFQGYSDEEILEKLINYSPKGDKDA